MHQIGRIGRPAGRIKPERPVGSDRYRIAFFALGGLNLAALGAWAGGSIIFVRRQSPNQRMVHSLTEADKHAEAIEAQDGGDPAFRDVARRVREIRPDAERALQDQKNNGKALAGAAAG